MLLGDKKKMAAAMAGTFKPMKEEAKADFPGAMEGFAADVLNSIKAGDAQMLAKSLSNFMQMCGKEEEYGED